MRDRSWGSRSTSVTSISRTRHPTSPVARGKRGMVLSPFRRLAAWADAERDAHTIVIATLSLSREGMCDPPVLPVLCAPQGARRVGSD